MLSSLTDCVGRGSSARSESRVGRRHRLEGPDRALPNQLDHRGAKSQYSEHGAH